MRRLESPHFKGGHCTLTDRPSKYCEYIGANRTPDVNGEPMMKMSRTAIALSLLGMVAHPVFAAPSFEETARQVIIAFQQRDNAKINALIDKKLGCMCCTELGLGLIISG